VHLRAFALPLVLLFAVASPSVRTGAPAAESPQGHGEEDTPFAHAMEGIRADLKQLGKQLGAKDQAAAWKSVCSLQQHVLEAKLESPAKTESVPDAERPAFVAAFRTRLAALLKATCDLETAVLAGDFAAAEKIQKETIWPMQKPAHKEFRNG